MSDAERCRICKNELESWDRNGICTECRQTLVIIDMPPARRPVAPCGKCGGGKIIRVIPRDHTMISPGQYRGLAVTVPMQLTVKPSTHSGLFSSHQHAERPDDNALRGLVEAYICRACGFIEWYCSDPQNIPIGPEHMTEAIDAGDRGPYR